MTRTTHSLRYTGSAIAAALAFLSTSSLAQDTVSPIPEPVTQAPAEPAIVIPNIPVAPASAPTIVVPPVQAETVQPLPTPSIAEPEPQASPSVATPAAQTRVTPPAARAAPPRPAAAGAPIAQSAPAELEPVAEPPPVTIAEPLAAEPAPGAVDEAARPSTTDDTGLLALTLGGFAFLGLAVWGFVAIGRRKNVRRYAAETPARRESAAPKPIVVEPAQAVVREPLAVAPRAEAGLNVPSFVPRQVPGASGALPHTGASVALPARAPESFAERDALMKRMIAAKPDRANPFTDRGARTRRARLILQSLGRDFGDADPWIDLSQYPNNWPELTRKRSAAA